MKYIIALIVLLAGVSAASAATGSTVDCHNGLPCAGGPTRGFNVTTQQYDLVPQCFPYVWLLDYYKGNIFDMYKNQQECRAKRLIDFGM